MITILLQKIIDLLTIISHKEVGSMTGEDITDQVSVNYEDFKEEPSFQVKKSGHIVEVRVQSIIAKRDIDDYTVMFSGLPKPKARYAPFLFYRLSDLRTCRLNIDENGNALVWYTGLFSSQKVMGNFTYLTEE